MTKVCAKFWNLLKKTKQTDVFVLFFVFFIISIIIIIKYSLIKK